MTPELQGKLDRLREILRRTGGCAVAYSGGVDSTLLLAVAHEVLGQRCLAIIATSSTYPKREYEQAVSWVQDRRIPFVTIVSEELDIPGFRDNPPDRCYHCKKELFTKIRQEADARGIGHIADGTNADDERDYRPGARAAEELDVLRPLKDAGLTKQDIRTISREVYELPTADKPAMACLASRFPYGSTISREKLGQVEAVEGLLATHGLAGCRARHHGDVLRLELPPDQLHRVLEPGLREACVKLAKECGFAYVTLDLEGYRTGSMNEILRTAADRRQETEDGR
jgi:uncharacterized protein